MPKERLTPDERRSLVLAALRREDTMQNIVDQYGIARSWAYVLLEEVKDEPEVKLEEAEKEAAFRKKVLDILRNRPENT